MAGLQWALLAFAIPFYLLSRRILNFTDSYGPRKRKLMDAQMGAIA